MLFVKVQYRRYRNIHLLLNILARISKVFFEFYIELSC
jgi:hypothetical protein